MIPTQQSIDDLDQMSLSLNRSQMKNEGDEDKEQIKTVREYEQQREKEEVFNSLRGINTLKEINDIFIKIDQVNPNIGQNISMSNQSELAKEEMMKEAKSRSLIPMTKPYFERFYMLKLEIAEKKKKELMKERIAKIDLGDSFQALKFQYKHDLIYNLFNMTEERLKLFLGEGGCVVQINSNQLLY